MVNHLHNQITSSQNSILKGLHFFNFSILLQFRFRDNIDVILMILGTLGSIAYGVLTPAQFLLMRPVTDNFVDFVQCIRKNCTNTIDLEDKMSTVALWYILIAFLNLLFSWTGLGLWGLTAERQVHKMRLAMFRNIIHQDIAWFDKHPSGELTTRLTEYVLYC